MTFEMCAGIIFKPNLSEKLLFGFQEKGDTEILKHETEISRILSKGNSVDATGDSIRNILDTNIPQETKKPNFE